LFLMMTMMMMMMIIIIIIIIRNDKWNVQFMNLLIMQFSTSHCHFLSLTCFATLRTKCNSY
jgi:hypothetical protein